MRFRFITLLLTAIFISLAFVSFSQDETPPVFGEYELELFLECSELDQIYVTATDDSQGEVTITYSDASFSGGCTDNIIRTYTATDPSGNAVTTTQILVVVDTTGPIFIGAGEDMTISCTDEIPSVPEVIVIDECEQTEIEDFEFTSSTSTETCTEIITWTWTAVDECLNEGSYTRTITIIDDTAPYFTEVPENTYINCSDDYPEAPMVMAEDDCTEVPVTLTEEIIEGGIEEGGEAYCTAQDISFFGQSFSMKLIESPALENYITSDLIFTHHEDEGEGAYAELTGNVYAFENPNAGFYIHMEFENGSDWENWSNQDFPTAYKDDFENVDDLYLDWTYFILNSTNSTLIGLGDYAGTELSLTHNPPNYYYGFQLGQGAANFNLNYGFAGWFQATGTFFDASSDDENIQNGISFDYAGDIYTELNCCPVESLVRTWTAEDECENTAQIQQVITKIDMMAPEFTFVPEDLLLECSEEIPAVIAEATDNCGEPVVTFLDDIIETECESEYTINRTFTATDNCGITSTATQIITVTDTSAPELSAYPENLVLDCDDELPPAETLTAADNCDDELTVMYSETVTGDMGPEEASAYCVATTPVNSADGWAGILFDPMLGDVMVTAESATYTEYGSDGDGATAIIEATLVSMDNPNAGWDLSLELNEGMNWEDWSNQLFPTDYKDDLGTAGDEYLNWQYFILDNGTLTGWGDWSGTSLTLSHAPEIFYYGFQLGNGASNVNSEYGIGGWMYYSGTIINPENGNVIEINGAGDIALDLDCCPMYEVERTWETTDCAGNNTIHTQLITFEPTEASENTEPVENEQVSEKVNLQDLSLAEMIRIDVSPNPVSTSTEIELNSIIGFKADLGLYNSQGLKISKLWDGDLQKNEPLHITFSRGLLADGIYILRVSTIHGTVSHKIIIQE